MRCSCKKCGTYMIQQELGAGSRCICPQCFFTCSACVTTEGGAPLSKEGLKELYRARVRFSGEEEAPDPFHEPLSPKEYED